MRKSARLLIGIASIFAYFSYPVGTDLDVVTGASVLQKGVGFK